jgi:alpha-L-fucosidase
VTEPAFDGDPDTFWSAPAGSRQATLEAHFRKPITFDHAVIMEWLNGGQHIEHYRIEVWTNGVWKTIAEGHAIGHKKIDNFPAVTTSQIRLNILSSSAEAHIREFQVFNVSGTSLSGGMVETPK